MSTCRKTLYRTVKISKVDGTVTPVGDAFDFAGETVDPTLFGNCPDVQNLANTVCVTVDGENCLEGVKQICQVAYDCATEETTTEVLSYILPDSTVVPAAEATEPFAVIACPEYSVVTDSLCELPKV